MKSSEIQVGALLPRRYDVDWLRTLALGLLITYHVMISFQPWATYVGFPQNDLTVEEPWFLMALINVWRIPILFLVSGMGVRFAMERRDWKGFLLERTLRILVPYLFGTLVLGGFFAMLLPYLGWNANYTIQFGHLWFLMNIYCYVLWTFAIIIIVKKSPDNCVFRFFTKLIKLPFGLFLLALPLMLEAWLVNPQYFSLFAGTGHGYLIGLLCYLMGFLFISIQKDFWAEVMKIRWVTLLVAFSLYLLRLLYYELEGEPNWIIAFESYSWMLVILGFGSKHLDKPSRWLSYLSKAVYPVYFVHMPVQFAIAYHLFPLDLPANTKLLIMLIGTFGGSFLLFEILKRLKWVRPLFGMKY